MRFGVVVWACVAVCSCIGIAGADIDEGLAKMYFEEARELSRRDGGRLWGVEVAGPMMLVEPATRKLVANRADAEGRLKEHDGVFVGELPESVGIANYAVEWGGTRWTMIMWPLPEAVYSRGRLMMHESFHRVQPQLNFAATSPANSHLDTMKGRLYLRLEWRALDAALLAEGEERTAAARDALLFRAARLSQFPSALVEERGLNMNEGLAEYTGWMLCGLSRGAAASRMALVLEQNEWGGPFARSFSYTSGPAYGFLLDEMKPGWRTGLTDAIDLPDLVAGALSWAAPADPVGAAAARMGLYQGESLRASEENRERARERRVAEWRARYFDSSVLVVPLGANVGYTYDPRGVEGYDDQSSVYENIKVTDEWGVLVVSKGALVTRRNGNVAEVRVPAPASADGREGAGWTLELKPGWVLKGGERAGDFVVGAR